MDIRPKDWWPPEHKPAVLSANDETKIVVWAKALVNTKSRYVTAQELRDAMSANMEAVVGKPAALNARALNAVIKRVDSELRAEETPLPEPDPEEL